MKVRGIQGRIPSPIQEKESVRPPVNDAAVAGPSSAVPQEAGKGKPSPSGHPQRPIQSDRGQRGDLFCRGKKIVMATMGTVVQTGGLSGKTPESDPIDRAWVNVAMSLVQPGGDRAATPINLPRTADVAAGGTAPIPPGGDRAATPINLPRTIDGVIDHIRRRDLGSARTEWNRVADQIRGDDRDGMIQHVLNEGFVQPNANLTSIARDLTPTAGHSLFGVGSILDDEASTLHRMFLTANAFAQSFGDGEKGPIEG